MSRLPAHDPQTAAGDTRALLDRVQATLGLVPNMTKVMANSSALLQGYLDLFGALARGRLGPAVQERIAVTVAEANACEYCLSAHTYIGAHIAHVSASELDAARRAQSEDPHTAAILLLASAAVRGRGDVSDAVFDHVRAAGVTDEEIAETMGHVALNVLTNLFNKVAAVDNDWPAVTPYPRAA